MNCSGFIDILDDYMDQVLPSHLRDGAEEHLAVCPYCRDYLETYHDTIELLRKALAARPDGQVPDDVSRSLAEALSRARGQ